MQKTRTVTIKLTVDGSHLRARIDYAGYKRNHTGTDTKLVLEHIRQELSTVVLELGASIVNEQEVANGTTR